MAWIVNKMKWIMLVSGALTGTMIYAAIAPQAALRSTFGATLEGPLAEIVVRNWGVLIALVGAMLIYGAFNAPSRPLVLSIAVLSKLAFIGLVLTYGSQHLNLQTGLSIAVDAMMVAVFIGYLTAMRAIVPSGSPNSAAHINR